MSILDFLGFEKPGLFLQSRFPGQNYPISYISVACSLPSPNVKLILSRYLYIAIAFIVGAYCICLGELERRNC